MANIKEYIKKILAKISANRGKRKRKELFGCGCCSSADMGVGRECPPNRG